jgi:hypothetical protein
MKRNLIIVLAVSLAIVGALFAQQRGPANPPGNGNPPAGPQSTISGTVVEFTAGAGLGMPTLVVKSGSTDTALVLGSYRVLQAAGFSAKAGDLVEATVIACADCPTGFAVISIKNLTNGTAVTLRNADGTPLANGPMRGGKQRGAGRGQGMGPGFGNQDCTGPDMAKAETVNGAIKSFSGGPGVGRPTLVVTTAAGDRTFMVSPYRAIIEAGYEFKAGAAVTIVAAPGAEGEWVVISLKDDATGATLVLRDGTTGQPIGGRGPHC